MLAELLDLDPRLMSALEALGIVELTEVQTQAIPLGLTGHDLQVSAETGSGKTLAYLLPIFQRLLEECQPAAGPHAVVLLPTRDLAEQVYKVCKQLADHTPFNAALVMGGKDFAQQAQWLQKDPDILIATPGRLLEQMRAGATDLDKVQMLALDEADRILDMGFLNEAIDVYEACRAQKQTLLMSATLTHKGVKQIARAVLREPQVLDIAGAQDPHANIQQSMILSDDKTHKQKQLLALVGDERYRQILVFTNKRRHCDDLTNFLWGQCRVGKIHGEVNQDQRKRVLDLYRKGSIKVLVATDVAARGLDIDGIDLVVNFDMAPSGDEYVHRIGRTGRAGAKGEAVSLVDSTEWNLSAVIQRYLKQQFARRVIEGLEGQYTGPKKLKSSGKAVGSKVKKNKKKKDNKAKTRDRNKKNVGKRRAPNRKEQ